MYHSNMKNCIKCHTSKSLKDYYKHSGMADGRLGICKECQKAVMKAVGQTQKCKDRDKIRNASPKRVAQRVAYAKTEKGKSITHKVAAAWAKRNPEKVKAMRLAKKLTRQPCEVCGAINVHGHHDDYSKPLEVRWLCPKHHSEHHKLARV